MTTTITGITCIYFSPVNNTRTVARTAAQHIAKSLAVPVSYVDFTQPSKRKPLTCDAQTLVVFATPTYAGRVPNKIAPLIAELFHSQGSPTVALVTYGNRNYDSSLTELASILRDQGFVPFAAGACVGTHAFTDKLAPGRPNADDLKQLEAFCDRVLKKLIDADANNASCGPTSSTLTYPNIKDGAPIQPYYIPLGIDGMPQKFLKAKPKTQADLCDQCGICAKLCPMAAIDPIDATLVPGTCIKCQACVRKCPKHAKYFDDAAFLSHVAMLEQTYSSPKENAFYL